MGQSWNWPGLLGLFKAIRYPSLLRVDVFIKDLRYLDWKALREAGYEAVVLDKDNCVTLPYERTICEPLLVSILSHYFM